MHGVVLQGGGGSCSADAVPLILPPPATPASPTPASPPPPPPLPPPPPPDDLLSLRDISVEESEQIPKILGDLVAGARDAVLGPGTTTTSTSSRGGGQPAGGDGASDGGAAAAAAAAAVAGALVGATPGVGRLAEVLDLMDIRMAEIRVRWVEGRLSAAGLEAEEVAHLVW